jgi:hypothetical protein
MIKDLLKFLSDDTELASLLDHSFPTKTKIGYLRPVKPNDYPFIVYDVSPYNTSNLVNNYRMSIRICCKDEILLEKISNRLITLLDLEGRNGYKVNNLVVYNSRLLTGGSLLFHQEENVFEQTMYFMLKTKTERN